jgi:hypothetical protein
VSIFGEVTLMRFDLSSIPTGSLITNASFMTRAAGSLTWNKKHCAHLNKRTDWVETEATWNIYKTGSNWETAGAKNDNDVDGREQCDTEDYLFFLTTTTASINSDHIWDDCLNSAAIPCSTTVARFVTVIQGKIGGNLDLILTQAANGNESHTWYDSEIPTPEASKPGLTITYKPPVSTPFTASTDAKTRAMGGCNISGKFRTGS